MAFFLKMRNPACRIEMENRKKSEMRLEMDRADKGKYLSMELVMKAKNIVPHARKTVIAGLLLAGLAGTAAAETVRYHSNGERACMYGYLDTTALSLCVYTNKLVGQGDDNRPVSAFLTYLRPRSGQLFERLRADTVIRHPDSKRRSGAVH
jgi:hypothetical protein